MSLKISRKVGHWFFDGSDRFKISGKFVNNSEVRFLIDLSVSTLSGRIANHADILKNCIFPAIQQFSDHPNVSNQLKKIPDVLEMSGEFSGRKKKLSTKS